MPRGRIAALMFKPHLKKAHLFWKDHLRANDVVIDATCGNGKDTAVLAQLVPQGHVYAIDIQEDAILKARYHAPFPNISFLRQCHTYLPRDQRVRLIVYNLGYLPGGNKQLTSMASTTLKSVQEAAALLPLGGALSITCYPGHAEGACEEVVLREWSLSLPPEMYHIEWSSWKKGSPTLLIVIKLKKIILN